MSGYSHTPDDDRVIKSVNLRFFLVSPLMRHDLTTHTLGPAADPHALIEREWLITNGRGGYAMGTALGCPGRRYHGLLVAAAQPPVGRVVALNQMFDRLSVKPASGQASAQQFDLSTCQFLSGDGERVLVPYGHQQLTRFERGLNVRWHYQWEHITVTRTLRLHYKTPAATLHYQVHGLTKNKTTATLRLSPMMAMRDFHALTHHGSHGAFSVEATGGADRCLVRRNNTAVSCYCPQGAFVEGPDWWYGLYYPRESERGQGDREDLFVPGTFEIPIEQDTSITFTATLGETPATPATDDEPRAKHLSAIRQSIETATDGGAVIELPETGDASETQREAKTAEQNTKAKSAETNDNSTDATRDRLIDALAIAADDFVVERTLHGQTLSTIIAGYPWFADWGRDTFIALPGLLLTTQRYDEARAVLRVFADAIDGGLVPNRFDDYTEAAAHYNTVDASLWFVHAAMQYLEATGDSQSWREWLAPACMQVVDAYAEGTGGVDPAMDPMIVMRDDGLIAAGNERTQLTWMDAACGDVVFTPRPGKAVEINALWYNALAGLTEHLAGVDDAAAARYQKLANRVTRHFASTFWSSEAGYLFDHVTTDDHGEPAPDPSLRPNQLLACALPRSPLGKARQKQVVATVTEHLVTPAGLRTLPSDDPNYHPRYGGDQFQRDEAYHQGTIWPWLIGPYAEAVLRTGEFSENARQQARDAIAPLWGAFIDSQRARSLQSGSIGQLAEIYEATPDAAGRFRPVGCIAQAWSVAEVLRISQLLSEPAGPR